MINGLEGEKIAIFKRIVDFIDNPTMNGRKLYIKGRAGTGKTFLLTKVCEKTVNRRVEILSLAGKAVDNIISNGVSSAKTIHSFLYKPVISGNKVVGYKKSGNFSDIIILDEFSLVNEEILNDLSNSCNKLILFGDPYQLPVIGKKPKDPNPCDVVELMDIHRNAKDSPIIKLAEHYRQGKLVKKSGSKKVYDSSILVKKYDGNFYIYKDIDIVLCGRKKTKCYVNKVYRKSLGIDSMLPITGERLLALDNIKDMGYYNGKQVIVERVGKPYREGNNQLVDIEVVDSLRAKMPTITTYCETFFKEKFDKNDVQFDSSGLGYGYAKELKKSICHFDFCYACTVHRFQGSQATNVLFLAYDNFMSGDDKFKFLYTGVTRAIKNLIVEI